MMLQQTVMCLFLGCLTFSVVQLQAACDECQEYGTTGMFYACVSDTQFKYCDQTSTGLVMDDSAIESCDLGSFCSDGNFCGSDASCVRSETEPACECDGESRFVCTSRNTFRMCYGTDFGAMEYSCPSNKVCSIASGKFCVDTCGLSGALECNKAGST